MPFSKEEVNGKSKSKHLWVAVVAALLCVDIFLFYYYWRVRKINTAVVETSNNGISSVPTVFESASGDRLSPESSEAEVYAGYREMGEYGAFAGNVVEKGADFLVVSGGGEKVKVDIVPETIFFLPLFDKENPGKILPREKMPVITINDVRVGDFVDIVFLGKITDTRYEAESVLLNKKM